MKNIDIFNKINNITNNITLSVNSVLVYNNIRKATLDIVTKSMYNKIINFFKKDKTVNFLIIKEVIKYRRHEGNIVFILYNNNYDKYVKNQFKNKKDLNDDVKIGKLLGYPCEFPLKSMRNKIYYSYRIEILYDGEKYDLFTYVCNNNKEEYVNKLNIFIRKAKKVLQSLEIEEVYTIQAKSYIL